MSYEPPAGALVRERLRTVAARLALLAAGLGAIGAALFQLDLATRPPCKQGYVRLVDLEPVGVPLCIALAVLALGVHFLSRRLRYVRVITGVTVAVLLFVALVDVGAVANLVHHHGARYDSCWTF